MSFKSRNCSDKQQYSSLPKLSVGWLYILLLDLVVALSPKHQEYSLEHSEQARDTETFTCDTPTTTSLYVINYTHRFGVYTILVTRKSSSHSFLFLIYKNLNEHRYRDTGTQTDAFLLRNYIEHRKRSALKMREEMVGKLKKDANEELDDVDTPPLSNNDAASILEQRQGLMQEQVRR